MPLQIESYKGDIKKAVWILCQEVFLAGNQLYDWYTYKQGSAGAAVVQSYQTI